MPSVNDRIKEVRTALNLSQKEFSGRIFISQSLYADIELGKVEAKERYVNLVSSQFKANLNWIKTGKGSMFGSEPPDPRLEHIIDLFTQLNPKLQDCVLANVKTLLKYQKENKL